MKIGSNKNRFKKLGTYEDFLEDRLIAKNTLDGVVPKIDRAYIREKKVGRFHYRYLVKKYRIDNRVVQRVLKYLGK